MATTSQSRVRKVVIGTDPAANTEITETVPAGKVWIVAAFSVLCVQGTTQTPQPILIIDDGTTTIYESFGATTAQAVSTTCRYTWAQGLVISGLVGATTNVHAVAPLPSDLTIQQGYRLRTSTVGIGANTNYGAPTIYVVELG